VRNSFTFFLEAFRRLPGSQRWKFLAQLIPLLRSQSKTPAAEESIFDSLAHYPAQYGRLGAMLGHPEKTPPAGEIEFLRSMVHRSTWYPGAIGASDFFFLTAFLGILAPTRVIEIGTLTGFSAAIIAAALSGQHGKDGAAFVETIDVRPQCLIDETQPTGFEIPKLVPDLVPMIHLHIPHDSSFVKELAKPNELAAIFIDADHRHPRVLLDVLRVAPYVQKNGWLVLHDVRLGTIGEEMRAAGQPTPWGSPYGAQWLFERWPFRKISGGNIGAIQLPNDKRALIPFALRLMSIPFEIEEKALERGSRALYQSFEALL
jgi:cephalosporin hydroxylase